MDRRKLRSFAFLTAFFFIVAACSRPDEGTSTVDTPDRFEGRSALDLDDDENGDTEDVDVDTDGAAPQTGDGAPDPGSPDDSGQAQAAGACPPGPDAPHELVIGCLVELRSTDFPGGNPNTWAGVNENEIKLAFSHDATNCGVNLINAIEQAGGNFAEGSRYYRPAPTDQRTSNEQTQEAVEVLVRYWNEIGGMQIANETPQAAEVGQRFGSEPGRPFYGRQLTLEMVDGGSFQCPERTTAGARRIAEEIQPFSVVTNDVPGINGSGYNMSAALHAIAPADTRPMHFGIMDPSDRDLDRWAPYVWTQFQSGTRAAELSASLICHRYAGNNAEHSDQYSDTERKFGLLYPNNDSAQQVASEFKGFIERECGSQIIDSQNEFAYSEDPARAVDEGNQMMVQLRLNGVTSVIYLMDLLGPLFHMIGAESQDYWPEWVWTGTAYQDTSTVQRLYNQEMVDGASFGLNNFGIQSFDWRPGAPFEVYHEFHKESPNTGQPCDPSSDEGMDHDPEYCKAPGALETWYWSLLPLIGGILYAGPDLTPHNVTGGLQHYPLTRYGRGGPSADPQAVLVGAGPGQHYFIVDANEFRWRSGYVSPPPQQQLGWVEFPDCQRKYMMWPDQMAPQFEPDGPNYNAYCGSENNAFEPYEPREGSCSDTPSGRCEKDNYPRWQ